MKLISTTLVLVHFAFNLSAQIPAYVPSGGLQGYWPFTGNANDVSGNGYNGAVNGASLVADRFSALNSAYSFNGSSDFIATNYQGILGSSARAVSFWAKTIITQPAMSAVAWGDNLQATRFQCGLNYASNGATIDGSFGAITYNTPVPVSNGQWHHYVYQFNNSTLNQVEVYQDAVLLTQTLQSYNPTNVLNTQAGFNVHFGTVVYTPSPDFFNGQLDDIGIWDRTLSLCEINQLYTCSLPSINAVSSKTLICEGQTATLSASGATAYQWNGSVTSPTLVVSPTVTTTYSVTGTTTLGCLAKGLVTVAVSHCSSIQNTGLNNTMTIYPNPTSGKIVLEGLIPNSTIDIYNALGVHVESAKSDERVYEIDLGKYATGVYFIRLKTENGSVIKKIIKE